jgi:putative oxidoreductase
MTKTDKHHKALIAIRIMLAAVMFSHGVARISYGTVGGFGDFLGSQGIPLSFFVAWGITLFEVIGSVLLAVGFYIWIIALVFALQLAIGIGLVHYSEGWFVVGHGRNGMEFSVTLIASLMAIAYADYKR